MAVIPNPTEAKDIALYFLDMTDSDMSKKKIARTIKEAKTLLSEGKTKEQILHVIDKVLDVKGKSVYSFGYIIAVFDDYIKDFEVTKKKLEVAEMLREELKKSIGSEVEFDGESSERNRNKANRIGTESRVREKFNFDLFKGN